MYLRSVTRKQPACWAAPGPVLPCHARGRRQPLRQAGFPRQGFLATVSSPGFPRVVFLKEISSQVFINRVALSWISSGFLSQNFLAKVSLPVLQQHRFKIAFPSLGSLTWVLSSELESNVKSVYSGITGFELSWSRDSQLCYTFNFNCFQFQLKHIYIYIRCIGDFVNKTAIWQGNGGVLFSAAPQLKQFSLLKCVVGRSVNSISGRNGRV